MRCSFSLPSPSAFEPPRVAADCSSRLTHRARTRRAVHRDDSCAAGRGPAARLAPASPVVTPVSPSRVSSSPTPPNVLEAAPTKLETPPKVEETASPPSRSEEGRVAAAPPAAPKQDASPTTVARVEDAKPRGGPEAPRRDAGTEKGGPREAPRSAGSLFGAPTPAGEERPGSGRAGPAPSSGGPPSSTGGGAGRAVAALPWNCGQRSDSRYPVSDPARPLPGPAGIPRGRSATPHPGHVSAPRVRGGRWPRH